MRSVVLEIKNGKAAVLDDAGVVHVIKDRGYETGQVISMSEIELRREEISAKTGRMSAAPYTRIAAAVLAVAVIGGGVSAYAAPVSTVTIDGEESVEYRLNIFDRVVGVEAAEGSDESFSNGITELSGEVRGMKITDAMEMTADRMEEKIPASGEEGIPEITVRVGGLKRDSRRLHEKVNDKAMEINERRPAAKPEPEMDMEKKTQDDGEEYRYRKNEAGQSGERDITDGVDPGKAGTDSLGHDQAPKPDQTPAIPQEQVPADKTVQAPPTEQAPQNAADDREIPTDRRQMDEVHGDDMPPEAVGGQTDGRPVQMPDAPPDMRGEEPQGGPKQEPPGGF